MSNIIFLKTAYEFDGHYLAIHADKIETLNVSDSYDNFGQKISASDAGDYLEINKDLAVEVDGELRQFSAGENVCAYDDRYAYDDLIRTFEDGEEITIFRTEFSGFNFWDGHNWKTVVVSSIDDQVTHEIEDDEEIIARLNEALENEEFESEGFGTKNYRYKDAKITYSQFSGAWEYADITLDNDFEEEEY